MTGPLDWRLVPGSVALPRPMFQVLLDDAQGCVCDVSEPDYCISNYESMRVPADEYARTDRIFL